MEDNLSVMRWTATSVVLAVIAFLVAAVWMVWVVSQGTNQFIQPGWWAFRYAAPLLVALASALAAVFTVRRRPPANMTAAVAIGVVAGLESLVFGVV